MDAAPEILQYAIVAFSAQTPFDGALLIQVVVSSDTSSNRSSSSSCLHVFKPHCQGVAFLPSRGRRTRKSTRVHIKSLNASVVSWVPQIGSLQLRCGTYVYARVRSLNASVLSWVPQIGLQLRLAGALVYAPGGCAPAVWPDTLAY